ncbi:MAG: hypothetical protein WDN04_17535 [Rhodospirillales bacterium]
MSSSSFVSNFICPSVSFMLDCSLLTVRVQPIRPTTTNDFYLFMTSNHLPSYSTGSGRTGSLTTGTWSVCTGGPGDAVLVEAVYSGPTFVGGFIPAFVVNTAAGLVHPTYAANGFINQTTFTTTSVC